MAENLALGGLVVGCLLFICFIVYVSITEAWEDDDQ